MTNLLAILLLATLTATASAQVLGRPPAQTPGGQSHRVAIASPRPASLLGNTLLSISATPSLVTFTLVPGSSATGSAPIAITSNLTNPLLTSVNVYAWFSDPTAALAGTTYAAKIPASAVFGQVPTGIPTTYTAFTQTAALGTPGATLDLIGLANLITAHIQTDNLYLKIDLSTLPQLTPDTYTGTVYIRAQAL